MSVLDAPKGYETAIYRVNTGTQMLEVIYSDKDLENEDAVEAYRIRKAIGSDDINGDEVIALVNAQNKNTGGNLYVS
mgnify:CR=1 FL=1